MNILNHLSISPAFGAALIVWTLMTLKVYRQERKRLIKKRNQEVYTEGFLKGQRDGRREMSGHIPRK